MPVAEYVCKLGGLPLPPWLLLVTPGVGVPRVGGVGLEGTCKAVSAVSFYPVYKPILSVNSAVCIAGNGWGGGLHLQFSSGCCVVKSCFELTDLLLK